MSRTRKKHPIGRWDAICEAKGKSKTSKTFECGKELAAPFRSGESPSFKKEFFNQTSDTEYAKKFKQFEERWSWPDDGKQFWKNPKAYRK